MLNEILKINNPGERTVQTIQTDNCLQSSAILVICALYLVEVAKPANEATTKPANEVMKPAKQSWQASLPHWQDSLPHWQVSLSQWQDLLPHW